MVCMVVHPNRQPIRISEEQPIRQISWVNIDMSYSKASHPTVLKHLLILCSLPIIRLSFLMSLFHITAFPALLTLTHTYSFRVLIVASTVRVAFLGVTQTAPFSWTSFSTRGRQRRICLFKTDFLWLTYFVASVHAERNPRKYGEVRGLKKKSRFHFR